MAATSLIANRRLQWIVAALLIGVAVLAVHLPAIRQNFGHLHWEDELFFAHEQEQNPLVGGLSAKTVLAGLYRPFSTTCYYYLVGSIVGPNPVARVQVHHVFNTLLYGANGLLLFGLGRVLLTWPWALVAALLFVSRRAHVEIVLNTVEFQALGASLLSFVAILCFIGGRRQERPILLVFSCLALALALLSKESALVIPAILLVYGRLYDKCMAWQWYLAPVGAVMAWGALFFAFFRSFTGDAPTGFSYTAEPREILTNYSAYFLSMANHLAAAPDSTVMPALLAELAGEDLIGVTLALLFALVAVLLVAHRELAVGQAVWLRPFAFGIAFFGLATAPYAILVDRLFMRYGYFGHAGLSLAAASLLWGCVLVIQARMSNKRQKRRFG